MVGARKQALRNSTLIREVNERIMELSDSRLDGEPRELLCECGDDGCIEAIPVLRADFQAARERPSRFLVAPDHGHEAATELFMRRDGYSIVEYEEGPG